MECAANDRARRALEILLGRHQALDLRSLVVISEAVTRSALERPESRGAHTRIDFPDERDECLAYNVVTQKGKDGRMEVKKVSRLEPPHELKVIATATLEELEK